jgi:hypothetical protein
MTNIAEKIIDKCGGAQRVADWLGLKVSAVHRWKYPQDRGGTGGLIPSNRQQELLERARAEGIDLKPSDFFEIDSSSQNGDAA